LHPEASAAPENGELNKDELLALSTLAKSRGMKRPALIAAIVRDYLLNPRTLEKVEIWAKLEARERYARAKAKAAAETEETRRQRLERRQWKRAEAAWILPDKVMEDINIVAAYPNRLYLNGGLGCIVGNTRAPGYVRFIRRMEGRNGINPVRWSYPHSLEPRSRL